MWAVLKFEKKNLSFLKKDFFTKLGSEVKFYMPKLKLQKYIKNKIYLKESFLLGNYLLCFHRDFSNKNIINSLKYCKGVDYFLTNFLNSQNEIEEFIKKCKQHEDEKGYLKQTFFELKKGKKYEFISGPFTNMIFNVLNENKFRYRVIIGKFNATVSNKDYLFRPV